MRAKILLLMLVNFVFAFDVYELANSVKGDVAGEFNQTKNITGFAKPIKSSGEFELKNGEFELRTLKPIQNAVKVSSQGVFALKNGAWQKSEQVQDTRLLLALISLDVDAIKGEFEPNLSGDANDWWLSLTPKGYIVSKIFKSIEIWGDRHVKKIKLTEINGDETINEFSVK